MNLGLTNNLLTLTWWIMNIDCPLVTIANVDFLAWQCPSLGRTQKRGRVEKNVAKLTVVCGCNYYQGENLILLLGVNYNFTTTINNSTVQCKSFSLFEKGNKGYLGQCAKEGRGNRSYKAQVMCVKDRKSIFREVSKGTQHSTAELCGLLAVLNNLTYLTLFL